MPPSTTIKGKKNRTEQNKTKRNFREKDMNVNIMS
jgi:hypothetical protein